MERKCKEIMPSIEHQVNRGFLKSKIRSINSSSNKILSQQSKEDGNKDGIST